MVPRVPRGGPVLSSVAITGAGGYLGSRLAATMSGHEVRALTRAPVPYLPASSQATVDLLADPAAVADALTGVDVVVHLAGHNEVVAAQDPDRALAETILATRHLAAAASTAGMRRIVYVSTVHVYGARMSGGAVLDEETPAEPRSVYAIARLACEHVLAAAAEASGPDLVVLRLTNAVGAPVDVAVDRWTLVAADLARQAVRTDELVLRSSGQQWRDFVALADVCDLVAQCVEPGLLPAGTYNLGSGQPMTVRALAELVAERFTALTGRAASLRTAPAEGPAPKPYRVRIDRLAAAGWQPRVPLADAVDELIRLCVDHEEHPRE